MNGTDFAFLAVGVVIVGVIGRLLAYNGRRYVDNATTTARDGSGSGAILVSVVFHLITLGLLALISVLPVGGTEGESFMLRIGVFLLVLGAVYGIAVAALARRRQAAVTEAAVTRESRPASLATPRLDATEPAAAPEAPPEEPPRRETPAPQRRPDGT